MLYLPQPLHTPEYQKPDSNCRSSSPPAGSGAFLPDQTAACKCKLTYPIKTIYSKEARVQLRKVLDDFQPDVCHLNNFNYQLTPSIILEIVKWRKETGKNCKIVFTAHDYQLVWWTDLPLSKGVVRACIEVQSYRRSIFADCYSCLFCNR